MLDKFSVTYYKSRMEGQTMRYTYTQFAHRIRRMYAGRVSYRISCALDGIVFLQPQWIAHAIKPYNFGRVYLFLSRIAAHGLGLPN